MDNFFPEGTRVWLRENGQHFPSTVNSCAEGIVVFRTDYGQVFTYKQSTITQQKVAAMHPAHEDGVDDMASLTELHAGSILYNLFRRYRRNQIYTYIGSILASVNPYQPIAGLYEGATMERYSRRHLGELPPHIFAIANECYRCLWKRHDNQCVLISGESGAGKTESTKLILKFLSAISQQSLELSLKEKASSVEQAILQSSPIMEAFGNAKTVYNSNSSRFGKFVQLHICQKGNIQGGRIVDCILLHRVSIHSLCFCDVPGDYSLLSQAPRNCTKLFLLWFYLGVAFILFYEIKNHFETLSNRKKKLCSSFY